ncbi:MAG: putative bifunctional diguanylate cyclase/phosphodiesterase [Janthinobacterium lividum]
MSAFDFDLEMPAAWSRIVVAAPRAGREPSSARDLQAILSASGALALYVDPNGRVLHASESSAALLAFPMEYLLHASVGDLVAPDHRDILTNLVRNAWARSEDGHARLRFTGGLAESRWLEVTIRPAPHADGTRRLIIFGYDVSEWVRAEQMLIAEALIDPLTGLGNRGRIRQVVSERILTAVRDETPFALALLDLDGFKRINDTLGHDIGDALLKEVAVRLRASVRPTDTVARMGGDEFVVLLASVGSETAAGTVAERILHSLRKPFTLADCQVRVTTSLGVAFSQNAHPLNEASLLKQADLAMYEAKAQGKNRLCVYSPHMERKQRADFAIEQDMFDAVQNGEFTLHYQPIFIPRTGKVLGLEALMRWERPSGSVPPLEFIAMAEHNGLINLLGDWALRSACQQLRCWDDAGKHFVYVSVNVSPIQFRHPGFVEGVQKALAASGLQGHRLVLEITEGTLMTDPEHACKLLNELNDHGVRIAVDDFGTGYSSLAYLQRLPLQALKIDRSFVADMQHSRHGRTIVLAVLSLARELGLISIAEGVETEEQCGLLAAHGCDYAQGWLRAPALPTAELERRLDTGLLTLHEHLSLAN